MSAPNLHNNMKTNCSDDLRFERADEGIQQKSDREQEQMILDCDNILPEQEELKLLNQQLQAQVVALQNRSVLRMI